MDMETLITDDICNIVMHKMLKSESREKSLAHLICYKMAIKLSNIANDPYNQELWTSFTSNFEIAYENTNLTDIATNSTNQNGAFRRIARKILCDMFKNTEIKEIYRTKI